MGYMERFKRQQRIADIIFKLIMLGAFIFLICLAIFGEDKRERFTNMLMKTVSWSNNER